MNRIEEGRSWLSKHLKIGGGGHHHHHKLKQPSSSLQTYESSLSNGLSRLIPSAESQSSEPSLAWAHEAMAFLISAHRGLQTFSAEINYPFEKWSSCLTDEYLADTLSLLDLLNSTSRKLSLISQHRLPLLLYAGSFSRSPTDKELQEWMGLPTKFAAAVAEPEIQEEGCEITSCMASKPSEEEKAFRRAMEGAKSVNLFIMKILDCCFSGHVESMLEMKAPSGHVWSANLMNLQMRICEEMLNRRTRKEGGGLFFQEVVDVNERVGLLLSYISSREKEGYEGSQEVGDDCDEGSDEMLLLKILIEDMNEKVEVLGKCLDDLEVDADTLFNMNVKGALKTLDQVSTLPFFL
ncbi:UPF0496 protein 4 [Nymphaea thermarum]|nr:UPF0496 protein 4 [Nymphaea thermarum]